MRLGGMQIIADIGPISTLQHENEINRFLNWFDQDDESNEILQS